MIRIREILEQEVEVEVEEVVATLTKTIMDLIAMGQTWEVEVLQEAITLIWDQEEILGWEEIQEWEVIQEWEEVAH